MENSAGRKLLEKRYGKGCFMKRAGIRKITPEEERELRKIKGYKKLNRKISYHHIKPKSKGGKVSIPNGANIAIYNHEWLHRQSQEVIDSINEQLIEFKRSIDLAKISIGEKVEAENLGSFEIEVDIEDSIVIPACSMSREEWKEKKKFNRARQKREDMKLIDEELYK